MIKRLLSPATNATGLGAAAAAVYAVVVMIWHVAHHQGVIDPQVLVGGAAAIWLIYTRFVVTPVKDPRDGNGNQLRALTERAVSTVIDAASQAAAQAAARAAVGWIETHQAAAAGSGGVSVVSTLGGQGGTGPGGASRAGPPAAGATGPRPGLIP